MINLLSIKNIKTALSRRAFSLVELLVVIAILGVMMALLIPAVNMAREAARKSQCSNNIKQMGTAALGYEQVNRAFPPGINLAGSSAYDSPGETGMLENWIIRSMPHLDQLPLYDNIYHLMRPGRLQQGNAYNMKVTNRIESNVTNSRDATVTMKGCRETILPILLCPSDGNNRIKFESSKTSGLTGARCNYAANMGVKQTPYLAGSNWGILTNRGVMGPGESIGLSGISDGPSNTILVAEIRAGVTAADPRGTWCLSAVGASAIAACGWDDGTNISARTAGKDQGPNSNIPSGGDLIYASLDLSSSELQELGMPARSGSANQACPRSMHSGGVFTCFADGSVHWISNDINIGDEKQMGVFDRILVSGDGYSIPDNSF